MGRNLCRDRGSVDTVVRVDIRRVAPSIRHQTQTPAYSPLANFFCSHLNFSQVSLGTRHVQRVSGCVGRLPVPFFWFNVHWKLSPLGVAAVDQMCAPTLVVWPYHSMMHHVIDRSESMRTGMRTIAPFWSSPPTARGVWVENDGK